MDSEALEKDLNQEKEDGLVNTHQLVLPSKIDSPDESKLHYDKNPVREKTMAILGAIAVTGLVGMSVFFGWGTFDENTTADVTPLILESVPRPPETKNPYYQLTLEARSAIVYDIHNKKILFEINKDTPLPLASLTKMMTALIASETFDDDARIAIPSQAIYVEGDSGLFANETWKVKDLISFTLLTSSNDGADALAAAAGSLWHSSTPKTLYDDYDEIDTFVGKMNVRAREIGLQNTTYTNPTGLDSNKYGGLGSAYDMSQLLSFIWQNEPEAFTYTNELQREFVSEDSFLHIASNTNKYVDSMPGLLASKTGYTDKAGGNLAVLYDSGMDHPIAVVVLGSSHEGRFEDVRELIDATYEYIESGWFSYELVSGSTPSSAEHI